MRATLRVLTDVKGAYVEVYCECGGTMRVEKVSVANPHMPDPMANAIYQYICMRCEPDDHRRPEPDMTSIRVEPLS